MWSAAAAQAPAAATSWTLEWRRIDPALPVRTFSITASGAAKQVLNAGRERALDTVPVALVSWARRAIDRAGICGLASRPADRRTVIVVTRQGRTCRVSRSVAEWRRGVRSRRVLAVIDSLESVVCRNRCSPFD